MRTFDENDVEVIEPDYDLGKGVGTEKRFVRHHDAVPAVEEVSHYETIAVYPNGGKDVEKVVDVPGSPAVEAWDEYEDIQRWHWYTPAEKEAWDEACGRLVRAHANYEAGAVFEVGGNLYRAIQSISTHERFALGVNCETISLADALNALNKEE